MCKEDASDLRIHSKRATTAGVVASRLSGNHNNKMSPLSSYGAISKSKSKSKVTGQKNKNGNNDKNNESSSLWWIHGKGYDLNEFVQRHPGGREAILLGRGRDCTALVESYHPFSNHLWQVLEKFEVVRKRINDDDDTTSSLAVQTSRHNHNHNHRPTDAFYEALKSKVASELKAHGIDPIQDRGATLGRTLYYGLIFVAWIISGYFHVTGSILGSFVFAIFGWLMGALGHDAGHFAASRCIFVNEWGVWAMLLICNPIQWQHQHTYGHHSFTNEFDHDPDLHHFHTFLRVHKKIRYEQQFRFQTNWLYVLLAYLFVVFGTCFWIPWIMITTGSLYGIVEWQDKNRLSKAIGMRVHMMFYVGLIMVIPFLTHASPWSAFAAVFLHISTLGIIFAIFSQVNHLNEASMDADMDSRQQKKTPSSTFTTSIASVKKNKSHDSDPQLVNSWAAAQVETSNNFASNSLLWHILSNGLNLQIEHHLFPGLNHCHLHIIAPVVRQVCDEYGVKYKSYDSWRDLMTATLRWYGKLSVDETCSSEHT